MIARNRAREMASPIMLGSLETVKISIGNFAGSFAGSFAGNFAGSFAGNFAGNR
jgi:hypothetical protein